MSEPEYSLIQDKNGPNPCMHHPMQKLVDIYNDDGWQLEVVGVDTVQFICTLCKSEKVYQLAPKKIKHYE